MGYVRIIKRTEADLLRGRGPSLQAARQGIAGARSGCESGPCADHDAWSSHRGEPARVTALLPVLAADWIVVQGARERPICALSISLPGAFAVTRNRLSGSGRLL